MNSAKVLTLIVGALTVGIGAIGILAGFGFLPHGRGDPTIPMAQQQAVAICIGLVFAAGGASAILSTLPGRASRLAMKLLGFVIVIGLTSLFGWVAVGPGSRGFASPLAVFGPRVNEVSGRIVFGLVAALGLLITVLMVRGFRSKSPEA